MLRTDKYSQHSSIIWPVWLNGRVFVYEQKWLWVRILLLPLKLQIWCLLRARSSLTSRQIIECSFNMKLVRDMIITYSQMYSTDTYLEHSSII